MLTFHNCFIDYKPKSPNPLSHIYHLPLQKAQRPPSAQGQEVIRFTCKTEETHLFLLQNGRHQGELNEMAGGDCCWITQMFVNRLHSGLVGGKKRRLIWLEINLVRTPWWPSRWHCTQCHCSIVGLPPSASIRHLPFSLPSFLSLSLSPVSYLILENLI